MHNLVFNNVINTEIREQILQHFQQQSLIIQQMGIPFFHFVVLVLLEHQKKKKLHCVLNIAFPLLLAVERKLRKIVSDVDDTFFSSGEAFLSPLLFILNEFFFLMID